MGGWNKTCGFSNFHIYAGEPVYIFVLKKNQPDNYNNCYSGSEYQPLLNLFEGCYDDYGGGENCHGPWLSYVLDYIHSNLIEQEVGENEYHEIAVKKDNFDINCFFDLVKNNRLTLRSYKQFDGSSEVNYIGFTMMHKEIVDKMLSRFIFNSYPQNYRFQDVMNQVENYWKSCKSKWGESNNLIIWDSDSIIHSALNYYFGFCKDINPSQIIFNNFVKNKPDKESIDLIKDYLKGFFINWMMEDLRKTWIPGGHEGAQSAFIDKYELLSNVMLEQIESERKMLDEW